MVKSRKRQGGMSLIEVTITLGVLAVTAGSFGMVVLSTQRSSALMRERDMVRAQGVKYLERIMRLPYGTQADPAASAAQVQELFDDNGVVVGGQNVTLMSLRTPENDHGWRFRLQGFEADGVFEVEVNDDLDGNGTHRGIRGPEVPTMSGSIPAGDGTTVTDLLAEDTPELLRIEIFFNGESLLRTLRAAPIEGT